MNKELELKRLGERVRAIRESKDISQTQLAYSIDKDQPSINRLEQGNINPSYIYLLEVCKGLDIEIKELF